MNLLSDSFSPSVMKLMYKLSFFAQVITFHHIFVWIAQKNALFPAIGIIHIEEVHLQVLNLRPVNSAVPALYDGYFPGTEKK